MDSGGRSREGGGRRREWLEVGAGGLLHETVPDGDLEEGGGGGGGRGRVDGGGGGDEVPEGDVGEGLERGEIEIDG